MKNVEEIIREYGEKLDEFKSPLAKNWETVLFKAIDLLHSLEIEGLAKTMHIKKDLLPMILTETYDVHVLDQAIQKTQELFEQSFEQSKNRYVANIVRDILDLLFAVKISINTNDKR